MDGGGETTAEARGLKKGPWTATEDAVLTEYVRKHGEGNWNAVQKNSGLLRCGKSCRLRWSNHLRPNLKKGSFSLDEEKMIIELHAKLGNKWARMASKLPGRTDNEIKNYWNTRMKRRKRANLPLYPQEIQYQGNDHEDKFEFEFNSFQFQNQDHQNHQNMIHQYTNNSCNSSPSSSSSFSSSSSQPPKRPRLDPLISTNPSLNHIPDSPINFQMFSLYNNSHENHGNNQFGLSSLPLSSSSSSSNELSCNPNQLLELVSKNSDISNTNCKNDAMCYYSSLLMGDHEMMRPSSFPLVLDNTVLELPSNQTPTYSLTSNTILDNSFHLDSFAGNSGLLDALLEESQALSRGRIFNEDKRVKYVEFENPLLDHLNSSHQSTFETNPNLYKKYNETTMAKESADDEDDAILMSLLNNFPSTTPLPDWYHATEMQRENSCLASTSGILIENHQGNNMVEPHKSMPLSGVDPIASSGSCYWGNMPRIC
ncbi:unnamed protein product [Cochlearia groenlandica]